MRKEKELVEDDQKEKCMVPEELSVGIVSYG